MFHFFQLFFKIFNFSLQFLFHVFLLLVFHLFSKNSSRIARSRKPPFNSFLWCCWTLWWKYSGFVWMFACGSSIIIFIFLKPKKKIQANKILHHFQIFIMRFQSKEPKNMLNFLEKKVKPNNSHIIHMTIFKKVCAVVVIRYQTNLSGGNFNKMWQHFSFSQ